MPRRQIAPKEALIESLSHEGRGLTHIDGKTTFVDAALPGERVMIRSTRRRRHYDEARVLEMLEPAANRIQPHCKHFGICGGCSLQHMDSNDQLAHKQSVLLEQLRQFGGVQPHTVLPPLTGPLWGYRRKARLAVKYVAKKGGTLVGFREKHSPYVADIASCDVLHPSVGQALPALRSLVGGLSVYDKVPQIEVAVGDTHTALVIRHLEPLNAEDYDAIKAFAEQHGYSIYLQSGGPQTIEPFWPNPPPPLSYGITDQGPTIYFEPTDFTQVNADINRAMIERVITLLNLKQQDEVLDLFCGLGNFTLPIAAHCARVTGMEGNAALIARAHANAARNDIENVQFQTVDLADPEALVTISSERYDKVLLDPPRTGAKELIEKFSFSRTTRIVYVSCNPATLARDAGTLVTEKGFSLVSCGIMDMFPHTAHVESVAVFESESV